MGRRPARAIWVKCCIVRSVVIQLDEPLFQALNRVAPPGKRQRSRFLREAVLRAVIEAEEQRTRAAYLAQPDSEAEADDWPEAGEYRP